MMTDLTQAGNANAWLFASIVEACPGFLYFIDDAGNVLISNQDTAVIVIRINADVFVYLNQCPHQGRRLDYAPGKFLYKNGALICAAHGASFEMRSGLCQQGPCRGESLQSLGSEVLPDKQSIRVFLTAN